MMIIYFSINFRSIVGDCVGMFYWLFDFLVLGFIIVYDFFGNVVLIINFDFEKYLLEFWNEVLCKEVLIGVIG